MHFAGISSKVDYLAGLGVGSVWISPVYKSPMKDNGYDISDYQAIDSTFGSMQDFKDLLASSHDQGIKVIMDFVPNHSSDQHEWFQKSVKREDPYTDYYVWKAGSPNTPPTNWKSVFGGSAWEYNRERGEWYLHQFMKEQPDLDLRNPAVVKEMKDVMRFWLDLGVDGFRIDSVAHFFEGKKKPMQKAFSSWLIPHLSLTLITDERFLDEEVLSGGDSYESVSRKYTYNLPECLDLLKEFRVVLDAKTKEDEYNPR